MHSATNLWKFHKSVALYYLYCSFLVYIRGFLLVFCLFVLAYVLVYGGDLIFNSCPHAKTSSFSPVEPTQAIIRLPDPQPLVLPSPCRATCHFFGSQYWLWAQRDCGCCKPFLFPGQAALLWA